MIFWPLVVSSIVLLGVANFTELGMRGYFGSVERFRLQTEARFVLEKLSREVGMLFLICFLLL